MAVYISLSLCALVAALLVYRYDMYEREPVYMLALALALGMGAGWTVGFAEDKTIALLGARGESVASQAAIAGSHEEAAKLLIVVGVALCFRRQFNDPMDGIIYGAFAGLGMGTEEAIFYVRLTEPETFEGHIPIRMVGHLLMGGIDGFALGMWRMKMRGWPAALAACLLTSFGLHFCWDFASMSAARSGPKTWQTVCAVGLMLSGMAIFGTLVVIAGRWSRDVFATGRPHHVWGWPFSLIFRKKG